MTKQTFERVEADGAAEGLLCILAGYVSHKQLGHLNGFARAAVDVDFNLLNVDVFEQSLYEGSVNIAFQLETY